MKLLIVGSRSISEFDIENYVPSDVSLIIAEENRTNKSFIGKF